MSSPKAQGVTGFLKRNGGKFDLPDTTIQSQNEYATINLVSLDNQPLSASRKVLVQSVTTNRLTGYQTKDATITLGKGDKAQQIQGEQIVRIGKPPFRIENTLATVTFRNPALNKATQLDINGYPKAQLEIQGGKVELPKDAVYVVLQAE